MLRGNRFRRLHRGVHVWAGLPESLEIRADAAQLATRLPSVLSHHTAAALRDLPVPHDERIHLTVPAVNRRPRIGGVMIHERSMEPAEGVTLRGRLVTSAVRTFGDLAECLSLVDLVILGDAMLRKGFADATRLTDAAQSVSSRGARLARRACGLVLPRVDSPMETRVRLLFVLGGLPCPEPGAEILDEFGHWVATVDLRYGAQKLVVEYDGDLHRTSRRKWRHDLYVRDRLRRLGWEVIVLCADDLFARRRDTLWRVRSALRERGHPMVPGDLDPEWEQHFLPGSSCTPVLSSAS